jgi:hypothetical protein
MEPDVLAVFGLITILGFIAFCSVFAMVNGGEGERIDLP